MSTGQKLVFLKDSKVQNKSVKEGTIIYLSYASENHAKENNVFIVCGKNGKPKSLNNPMNHFGISQSQLEFALKNEILEAI